MSDPTPEEMADRILRRMPGYLREGLEGQDGIEAVAAVAARLSARTGKETRGAGLIEQASGTTKATAAATVTPPDLSALGGDVVVPAGQVVAQTAWGVEFALTEPLLLGPGPEWLGGYLDCDGSVFAQAVGALAAPDALAAWSLVAVLEPPDPIAYPENSGLAGDGAAMWLSTWADHAIASRQTEAEGTYLSDVVMAAGRRAIAAVSASAGVLIRVVTDEVTGGDDGPIGPVTAADAYIGWDGVTDPPMVGKVYAVLAVSGEVTQAELLSILPVLEGGGGLTPWDVWAPARILRLYLPHLAHVEGADNVIPDVAELVGGGVVGGAVDAVMISGGLERIVNSSGQAWPLSASPASIALEAVWAGAEGDVPGWAIVWTDPLDWTFTGSAEDVALVLAAFIAGAVGLVASDATGGATGWLDLHAADRGIPRAVAETDAALRRRLRSLPKILTPVDIEASASSIVQPYNATARVSEWWEHGFVWGVSGWGIDAWVRRWSAVVLVRAITPGADMSAAIAAVEQYLTRARPFGVWVAVYEEIP